MGIMNLNLKNMMTMVMIMKNMMTMIMKNMMTAIMTMIMKNMIMTMNMVTTMTMMTMKIMMTMKKIMKENLNLNTFLFLFEAKLNFFRPKPYIKGCDYDV